MKKSNNTFTAIAILSFYFIFVFSVCYSCKNNSNTAQPINGDTLKVPEINVCFQPGMIPKEHPTAAKQKQPVPPVAPPVIKTPTTPTNVPAVAPGCIYLNFNGANIAGTSWNVSGALNIQGAGMDTAQQRIVYLWVADKYRPYNVNVTLDSNVYNKADPKRRIMCLFTTTSDWYGNVGGVSFTNSFTWGNNTPCFIFPKLLNYNLQWVADAATHEIGHTLGLRHQATFTQTGTKINDYNYGNAQEAPIMGVPYYSASPRWWVGPNSFNVQQNDTAILNTTLGKRM